MFNLQALILNSENILNQSNQKIELLVWGAIYVIEGNNRKKIQNIP
jgi:hypothetical protein